MSGKSQKTIPFIKVPIPDKPKPVSFKPTKSKTQSIILPPPKCSCNIACREVTVMKDGPNYGKLFYAPECGNDGFLWKDHNKRGTTLVCKPKKHIPHYIINCETTEEAEEWKTLVETVRANEHLTPTQLLDAILNTPVEEDAVIESDEGEFSFGTGGNK